jgi:hypothetical protein
MRTPFLPVIGALAACCVVLGAVVTVVDPYHLHSWGLHAGIRSSDYYSMQATPYLIEAVAKDESIDTLFIGTSTGHAYSAAVMEEILPGTRHAFNLSYSEPSSTDRALVANALLQHSHARRFVIEADWTYMEPSGTEPMATSFPDYFYDSIWWNDVRGINWQALKLSWTIVAGGPLWIPRWSQDAEQAAYRRRYALLHSDSALADFEGYVMRNKSVIDTGTALTCSSMSAINEALRPFVRALSSRGAEVDVVVPVYSWLLYYWKVPAQSAGINGASFLRDQLQMRKCLVLALDGLPSVSVFAFDDVPGLADDWSNYFDPVHLYNQFASRYVLQSIAAHRHLLTRENIDERNETTRRGVVEYQLKSHANWAAPTSEVNSAR